MCKLKSLCTENSVEQRGDSNGNCSRENWEFGWHSCENTKLTWPLVSRNYRREQTSVQTQHTPIVVGDSIKSSQRLAMKGLPGSTLTLKAEWDTINLQWREQRTFMPWELSPWKILAQGNQNSGWPACLPEPLLPCCIMGPFPNLIL